MGHDHEPANFGRAFAIGITLNLAFVIIELIYGRLSNSLVLVADAGHNLGDVLGLSVAWGASVLARRISNAKHTYGFRRSTILAALINAAVILIGVGAIGWEAIHRLKDPSAVEEKTVIWVAALGILIDAGTALLFISGRKGDLNIRGAFIHLVSDAVVSVGVVLTGVAILYSGYLWLDPVVSLAIVALITYGTLGLLMDSVHLSMDGVPDGIDMEQIKAYLETLPKCSNVHDLHVWGMSTSEIALTAHVVLAKSVCDDALLSKTAQHLHDTFGIEHTTLQVEHGDPAYPCNCHLISQ
ncbi:cation diffusion facilitator family transporter [soil metagenome]